MTLVRLTGVIGIVFCGMLGGCRQTDFPQEKAQGMMADHALPFDAEQVILTGAQVDCGIKEELWDTPTASGEHQIARLQPAARALKFDDDVIIGDPGYRSPYAQIRGDFHALLADGPEVRDPEPNVRMVTGKLMVLISDPCFAEGLPVMGVKKGKFSEEALPVMRFELFNDGWHYDKLVH